MPLANPGFADMTYRVDPVPDAVPPTAVASRAPRRWTGWLFGLLVLSTLVAVVADRSRIGRFADLLSSASVEWLLVGLATRFRESLDGQPEGERKVGHAEGHGHLAYDSGEFKTVFLRPVMRSAKDKSLEAHFVLQPA